MVFNHFAFYSRIGWFPVLGAAGRSHQSCTEGGAGHGSSAGQIYSSLPEVSQTDGFKSVGLVKFLVNVKHQKNTPLIFKLTSICFKQLVQSPPKISAWKILTFFEAQKVMMEVIGLDSIFPDFSWGKTFRVSTQMAKLVSTVKAKCHQFSLFFQHQFSLSDGNRPKVK